MQGGSAGRWGLSCVSPDLPPLEVGAREHEVAESMEGTTVMEKMKEKCLFSNSWIQQRT